MSSIIIYMFNLFKKLFIFINQKCREDFWKIIEIKNQDLQGLNDCQLKNHVSEIWIKVKVKKKKKLTQKT